ncbi:MAG: FAD-dependent oxidoreductase [Planctomycetia bacterium]|nr:FAD-dependent oxidoreductase [Planctomycetia bacterium]
MFRNYIGFFFIFGALLGIFFGRTDWVPADEVSCEIVVAGGGSAGIAAALFAGEAGSSTILLEATHQIGGNTTSGGVSYPGLFHAWGKQVIAGPAWDLILKTVKLNGGKLPDFTKPVGRAHSKLQISINPALFVLTAEETLQEKGVEIRYYESPSSLKKTAEGWILTTSAMGETRTIHCKQLIDCTGNGALCAMAGAKRLREKEVQPGTMNYLLETKKQPTLRDKKEWNKLLEEAVQKGTLRPEDIRSDLFSAFKPGRSSSFNYVYEADNSTAEKRTETNLRGRAAVLRVLRFMRTLPGLEDARIVSFCPEVGVRETWRVRGDYLITVDDYTSGKVWDDSLCFAYYPVDLHTNATGVHPKQLTEGIVPTIPLRAMLPAGVENMLVAGRCISSDRLANSGLRVQGACMSGGQAAAAAAVIASRENTTVRSVSIKAVKDLLKKYGCIVP